MQQFLLHGHQAIVLVIALIPRLETFKFPLEKSNPVLRPLSTVPLSYSVELSFALCDIDR